MERDARAVCIVARETYDRHEGCLSWAIVSKGPDTDSPTRTIDDDVCCEHLDEYQYAALCARGLPHVRATRGQFRLSGIPFQVTVVVGAEAFAFAKWCGPLSRAPPFPAWIAREGVTDARYSMRAWAA
jgi:hypothetical protein